MSDTEFFISCDVETAGPAPGKYSLLSIGACDAFSPSNSFYRELKPINRNFVPEALEVSGLDMDELERTGTPPEIAMKDFLDWTLDVTPTGSKPVLSGLAVAFDWCFVNYYFHVYLGENPFGFAPLDIKPLFMGVTGCGWGLANSTSMDEFLKPKERGNHNALQDAVYQAELLRLILAAR